MELAVDRTACLWILILSCHQWLYHAADRRFFIYLLFFFLLWTGGGGGVDGGCGCGCGYI